MKEIILDITTFETELDLHNYLKEQLQFPDYYGNNLDSLYDCLTDINEVIIFQIKNCSELFEQFQPVFDDVAEENSNIIIQYNH